MPTVDVVDLNNQKVSELELADDVFGAPVNEALLYEAVRQFQAGHHAGTHKTKGAMNTLATLQAGRTVLVVDNEGNRNLQLGLRNLQGVTLLATREVNPYHLLGHQSVLISEAAARKFSEALAK